MASTINPQFPAGSSDTYTPDRLIAGVNIGQVTDAGVIVTGQNLTRGALLGKITLATPSIPAVVGTGNGLMSAISLGAKGQVGSYVVKMTGATAFTVTDPNGDSLPAAAALGAYTDAQINFTITAGGTAFIAGDTFTIVVAAGSGKFNLSLLAATDGSQVPYAVLAEDTNATSADKTATIYLTGEFNPNAMTFGTGHSATTAVTIAALRDVSIYLKTFIAG